MKLNNNLDINSFSLSSSSEILNVVRTIQDINKNIVLIHIFSFMHNTVLVQNLKSELSKILPDVKIALLKHDDKTETSVVAYSLESMDETDDVSDVVLKELQSNNKAVKEELKECSFLPCRMARMKYLTIVVFLVLVILSFF